MTPLPRLLSRVMIVEDDVLVRTIHQTLIEDLPGFQVVSTVGSLAQASQDLQSVTVDLLLVDIYLPDGNGLTWAAQLPRISTGPDVIMITAANDLPTVQTAIRSGVLDFLIKPFERQRLYAALQRHQQRHSVASPAHLTQYGVDRLLRHDPVTHLPKGIDAATLGKVQRLLDEAITPLSAETAGRHLGVSRITAWRYLEYLVGLSLAEVEVLYQSTGRPLKLYQRSRHDSEILLR
ncbi:response regulator [Deinococcus detaillensis]|uniref:Transcriptional regulatory protein n=1 Tax=Deinococcus detaillensis TaxID=2592048 RepID=A0A553UK60_9DEIO|nr:response regulator [Deinococcus detaillensis]TSA80583.1 response regulator [Deinococcus detaillensis]